MLKNFLKISVSLCLCGLFFALTITAQTKIPAPKDVLGFTPGDDRRLASWAQVNDYFKKLDAASDRVIFEEIGKTTMGAPFVYATISSPQNLKKLKSYQWINEQLADPRKFKSADLAARRLIKDGKTIVLITCGVHSTEVGSYLSSMLIAEKLANATDPETRRILDNTIVLLVPSLNPDGVDIVKNWYDKTLGTPFEGTEPPELYHKYVGHDDNRDWYAFTQVETQLTVDKIHNAWHPQIIHDIHQQGAFGARMFLPPYMPPVEPNVPKQLVEGYTELGNFMAQEMRAAGFQGITTDSTYDAWTPARAYSHYHGGVRILSETASARLATPITVKFEELRNGLGYDVRKESANFSPVWKGGEWKLRNITDHMTTGAFALLRHASDNRERWLTRFYEVGKEAVRPRPDGELQGFLLTSKKAYNLISLVGMLERGGVRARRLKQADRYADFEYFVPLDQPYGAFAKTLLEKQVYPNLKDAAGNPIPPYDVTAHTLPLLMDVRATPLTKKAKYTFEDEQRALFGTPVSGCRKDFTYWIYRSSMPSMDEGWTRWVFKEYADWIPTASDCRETVHKLEQLTSRQIQAGDLSGSKVIIFPDQSTNQIMGGYAKGAMPDEFVGGVGKEGVANLRRFVEAGGTLVFLNRSSDFAIEQFELPVRDVTDGVARKDFYIPGSILRIELDTTHPLAKNMDEESIAWFENSPAFEIKTDPLALANNFRIIARYPKNPSDILLSGWALGAERLAGKAALIEFTIGKGKIYLFGFRPQYRGQSLATFPLLFNALGN